MRLAIDNKISREEFLKYYIGNEINPKFESFLKENPTWKAFFALLSGVLFTHHSLFFFFLPRFPSVVALSEAKKTMAIQNANTAVQYRSIHAKRSHATK